MFDSQVRYLQFAFNDDITSVSRVLPKIPVVPRILIEAGTPFIKREGMSGIRHIRRMWSGAIVADLKISDGAIDEVDMAHQAGATAATVLGSAPIETIRLFIQRCSQLGMASMIDTLGVQDPLHVLRELRVPPDVVVLHRGRDKEGTRGKVIQYRHVKRVKSKFDVLISAAGGVDLRESRSAIFNGASIVVVNIVRPGVPWQGIRTDQDVAHMAQQFLNTVK